MAKELLLKAEIRERKGSKAAQKVINSGRIPAIIYGHKEEPISISLDAHDFVEGLHHGHRLIDVQLGKKKQTIIVKALQYDHLGKNVIHADFMRVDVRELVKITVPIELKGTAQGTTEGGIVEEHSDHIEIECKATDIPERIVISVKNLKVGDSLHAGDIELPEGVKLVSSPDTLLISCHLVAAAKTTEEVEAEMPAGPEVIGEVKEAEEGESEEK